MMGERTVAQEALFYEFSLERHVPAHHLLRAIDRFVDLSGIRAHLRPFYSDTGRPSIDPELMIRMLIVGYCFGIRSERRLCDEVHLNLAYRWFCRLGLEGDVPDHSTFSKNRHGHGDDQEDDYANMLEADTARRIRVRRAAFNVGELMVPTRAAGPGPADRGLATWPLQGLDLTLLLPPRGGEPVFADQQAGAWAGLLSAPPDLEQLADRVERLLKTADRLFLLAARPGDNNAELRRAAEGAQIMAYLAAARVAIWPVERGSAGVKAKRRMAEAIDDRACRGDPLHMQAAVRHIFEEATWLAKLLGSERMANRMPTWTEIV